MISAWLRQRPAELVAAARTAADVGWWVVREELLCSRAPAWSPTGSPRPRPASSSALRPRALADAAAARDDTPAFLTPREVELGRLAADGVPSAAIALRLGVSQRTVDNLLGRVYAKCGVTGRRMLAAASVVRGRTQPRMGS